MIYPPEFIKEVREIYPNSKGIEECIKIESPFLGRYLDDARYGIGVSADEILNATSLTEIQDKVKIHKKKEGIYSEWCKLYEKEHYK